MKQLLVKLFTVGLCWSTVAACTNSGPEISAKSDEQIVVVEVYGSMTDDGLESDGYLVGIGSQSSSLSVHHDLIVADAALACGSPIVTVVRSYHHVAFVSFPSASSDRFDGLSGPSDFEIVKCIQQQVDIPFRPGISNDGGELVGADTSPFRALDTQKN